MLWACVLLPQLALDGVLRRHPQPDQALALVTGPAQKRVLAAVNCAAARAGLHAGQALAAAHALLPQFATVEYDAAEVARWRDFLAAWAYRYSSQVGAVAFNGMAEDAIVLEIGASLRLFGPWPRFDRQLREDLTALGFTHCIAVAPNDEMTTAPIITMMTKITLSRLIETLGYISECQTWHGRALNCYSKCGRGKPPP